MFILPARKRWSSKQREARKAYLLGLLADYHAEFGVAPSSAGWRDYAREEGLLSHNAFYKAFAMPWEDIVREAGLEPLEVSKTKRRPVGLGVDLELLHACKVADYNDEILCDHIRQARSGSGPARALLKSKYACDVWTHEEVAAYDYQQAG